MTEHMPARMSENEDSRPSGLSQILLRRRWFFLAPFFALGLVGYGVANLFPLLYKSSAFIIVEQQKVPEQYVTPNILLNLQKRLDSMTQQILSRTRLQRFIEDFGLYASERKRMPMDDVIDKMRSLVSVELVQTTGGRSADLTGFRIHFSDRDRFVAQRVTNELTSLFIEQDARERTSQSQETTAFLESQLDEGRKQLDAEEAKIREYKLHHLGELPDQRESSLHILSSLETQLQASTSALDRAEQQRIYLESMRSQNEAFSSMTAANPTVPALAAPGAGAPVPVAPGTATPAASNSGATGAADVTASSAATSLAVAQATLKDLWAQLRDLSAKYTDRHPEVMQLKKEIAEWEVTVDRLEKERTAGIEIESRLKAVRAEIETERRESSELRRRIGGIQAQISQIPIREQELAELTRLYEGNKTHVQSLLQKKQGSELASNLEERQGAERFRLVDPANLPKKPEGRQKIVIVGWVLAFALGAGLLFLRETSDQSVHRAVDLEPFCRIPVLARIPTIRSTLDEQRLQFRWKLEVAAVAVMVLMALASGAHTYLQG